MYSPLCKKFSATLLMMIAAEIWRTYVNLCKTSSTYLIPNSNEEAINHLKKCIAPCARFVKFCRQILYSSNFTFCRALIIITKKFSSNFEKSLREFYENSVNISSVNEIFILENVNVAEILRKFWKNIELISAK